MRLIVGLALPVFLVACGLTPSQPAPVNLGISNGTTLTVTLVVNGQRVAEVQAGGPSPTIDPAGLPPLPWSVEPAPRLAGS